MSFLNAIFLMALPLAAVPVALHFYRRQQRDVVAWGAMQFLQNAAKHGRRRERLEELLLMLLRCAAVLALVLALARPQLTGQWLGDHASREVILVLDNSMSMARVVDDRTAFDELQERAQEVIGDLSNTDVVQVMLAVGGPNWLTSEALIADTATKASTLRQIEELQPTLGAADFLASIQAAVDTESPSDLGARHIIVLTDRQAHGWQQDAKRSWQRLRKAMESNDVPTSVQVIACGEGDKAVANLAIMNIAATQTQIGVGQSVNIQASIQNLGESLDAPVAVEHLVNGEVSGTAEVPALAKGEASSVSWTWSSSEPGVYAVSCRVAPDDQLPPDDDSSVIVEVVDRIPVLIVDAALDYRQRIPDAELFTATLGYDGATPHDGWNAVFAPTLVTPDDLETTTLSDYQAVVVTGLTPLLSSAVEKLQRFVEDGGGLWVVLGRRTDRESFNAVWYDDGGGLSPLPLGDLVTHDGEDSEDELIHPPSADHPTTAHLSDTNRLDIDAVRIRSRQSFERQTADEQLSILLETGDGDPLVIEQYVGRGRVIIQALPFGVGWSNLPLTKSYVVMVHDWLEYLTHPAATQFNLAAGTQIDFLQALIGQTVDPAVTTPEGYEQVLTLRDADNSARYRFSQTQAPGRYDVKFTNSDGESGHIPFQIARDAQESDLTMLTEEEQRTLAETSGLGFSGTSKPELPKVTSNTGARPIWSSLLIGLLILLALELLLATRAARSRSPESSLPSFDTTTASKLAGTSIDA